MGWGGWAGQGNGVGRTRTVGSNLFQNELAKMGGSVCVPRVSPSCLLPLWETLQDQQVGPRQASFKLLLLPWVLERVWFCECPLRVESVFPTVLWDS